MLIGFCIVVPITTTLWNKNGSPYLIAFFLGLISQYINPVVAIHGAITRVVLCVKTIAVSVCARRQEKAGKTSTEKDSKSSYQEQENASRYEDAERQRREEALRRERKRRAEEARQRRAKSEGAYSREEAQEKKDYEINIPKTRKEAYNILGVSENASKEECHRAYRHLQAKYHVDKFHRFDGMRKEAERATVLINLAWDILR